MTLGSLFDGIGTWQLAAQNVGITPVWSSEIEKFPLAVTARRFPSTKQLGDIRNITDAPHVDIVTASSPCQDVSIAGKQGGIHGERSGLFFKAADIVRRVGARYFVWENVGHVLHGHNGSDLQAVLAELAQTEIPIPERGFADAGLVDCRRGQICWRVLDAQHFGCAQRRKRVFLVADFAGRRAGEILFEPASLRRNSATREGSQQAVATRTRSRADVAVYENHWKDSRIKRLGDVAPTVAAMYGTGGNNIPLVAKVPPPMLVSVSDATPSIRDATPSSSRPSNENFNRP